jgi:hypothetical protein
MTNNNNITFNDFENEASDLLIPKQTHGSKLRGKTSESDWEMASSYSQEDLSSFTGSNGSSHDFY